MSKKIKISMKSYKLSINTKNKELAIKKFTSWIDKLQNNIITIKAVGVSVETKTT